jgi:hypothetical protein
VLRSPIPALLVLAACKSGPALDTTGDVSEQTFHSDLISDDYILRVRLPPDVDMEGSYPLIVQLDPTYAGLHQFATTGGLVSKHEAEGDWPEAVIVGVDYADPSTRERDYRYPDPIDPTFQSDHADLFYRVLTEEILPHLDDTLPVDPTRRLMLGHSNGGVFGWYTIFRHDPSETPPFAGVIAADAGLEEALFTYEGLHAERADALPTVIYATHALYNGATQKIAIDALEARLRGRGFPDLNLTVEGLDTDHGGAVIPSYEHGLDKLFSEIP